MYKENLNLCVDIGKIFKNKHINMGKHYINKNKAQINNRETKN